MKKNVMNVTKVKRKGGSEGKEMMKERRREGRRVMDEGWMKRRMGKEMS